MINLMTHVEPQPALRYDGEMFGGWLQFTELDRSAASFGASFYLQTTEFSLAALAEKRAAKREQFATA